MQNSPLSFLRSSVLGYHEEPSELFPKKNASKKQVADEIEQPENTKETRVAGVRKGHEQLSWYYTAWSNVIMWTLVGTSAAATILAGLSVKTQQSEGVKIATVALTAMAAFMSAWQRLLLPTAMALQRRGILLLTSWSTSIPSYFLAL